MPAELTVFQWLAVLAFFVVHAVAITYGVSILIGRVEKDCAANREADRKEHDEKHKSIWTEIDMIKAKHSEAVNELGLKIAERPDRKSFEETMTKLETRLGDRIDQVIALLRPKG